MKKLFILLFSCMMLVACGGSKSNGGNGIIGGGGNNGGNGGGGIFSQTTSSGGGGGQISQSTNNGYPESELKAFLKKYGYSGQVPVWAGGANYEYEETTMYGLPAFGIVAYVNNQNALNTATNELYSGCTKLGFQVASQTQDGVDVYIAAENTDKLAVMFYPYSSNGMYGLITLYIVNTSGN